jgi:hypothetical protein
MPDRNDFRTLAEMDSLLKLNPQTLRNRIDSALLPALHIGRWVRIRRADFDAVIEPTAIGEPQPAPASIWDAEIPQAQVAVDRA